MRSITGATRTAYLSGDVTPTIQATLRQLRLRFEDASGDPRPIVYNTYNVIDAGVYASDGKEGPLAWGGACVNGTYKIRILTKSVWGDTADYFASITDDGADAADWDYADITNSATTPDNYCRVGVYSGGGTGANRDFYVWYVSSGSLYRETLNYNSGVWSWSSKTGSGLDLSTPGFDAIAVHPVSASEGFVVGFQDHYIWVRYCKWNGADWTDSGSAWTVISEESLDKWDATLSAAEDLDGAGKFVIVINGAGHGAAHSVVYNSSTDLYSQPFPMLGGGVDDAGLRTLCAGLTLINSRVWAVVWRAVEGSDEIPYAEHIMLASTENGIHWREEGFVGVHLCHGRLLFASSDSYAYVAGNACVYRAPSTNALGYDNSSMKKTVSEAEWWRLQSSGAGSATQVDSSLLNVDSGISGSDLFRDGNELTLDIGISGSGYDTLFTSYLARKRRKYGYADLRRYMDRYTISARGPLYWLDGEGAYYPPAGKIYHGPTPWYSKFTSGRGNPLMSLASIQGTWDNYLTSDRPNYTLRGKPKADGDPGIAVVPRSISSSWLTVKVHFEPRIGTEGFLIVFFYQDTDNYWRAGIRNDGGQRKLVIDKVADGTSSNKATTNIAAPAAGTSQSFYLDLRPGMVRIYWKNSEGNDFSSVTASRTYDLTQESSAEEFPYHIGLMVMNRADETEADDYGTVTKAFARQIQDSTKDFDSTYIGKHAHVNEDWRQIVDYTVVAEEDSGDFIALTVDTAWSEVPSVGDDWGVWSTSGDPYVLVSELYWCDGLPAWTIDDIVDDILETSGVGRTSAFTGTIPTISTSSQKRDVDLRITGDTAPQVLLHGSAISNYTAWRVDIGDSYHSLYHIESGGTPDLLEKHPNLVSLTLTDTPEIRVVVSEGNVLLYADDHYLGCFQNIETSGMGYVAKVSSGTVVTTEFSTLKNDFAWGADESPNSALRRLLRGRKAKIVERADGSVSISEYTSRDTLGGSNPWASAKRRLGEVSTPQPSLIEVLGAEVRAYYIRPEMARYQLRFRRYDNPTVVTEADTLQEAYRLAALAEEASQGEEIELYAPDPATECEDEVTISGTTYIVNGYVMFLGSGMRNIKSSMEASLRGKTSDPSAGSWGTSLWGQFNYG